ncbi:hypothetical protein MB901379_02791 [Mycobacterium basiliense]|uniref:DUF3349 domain-containing protein n=1 Tax=Mycobacterium basiliense TaxID=2094119 RepID=A0A3S4BWW6_9MYCO|nr:DUF3349 domain-containing protein [Mycobacterium basiliense]VDM89222.1 hypothetical protein MB901379_02791 [Mycobacterium basiliense]
MAVANWVSRVIAFLRAGYPTGMPVTGYVPLAALAQRRVSHDEATAIASNLIAHLPSPISNADVGAEITKITHEMPSHEDIQRVQSRIRAT